MRKRYTPAPCTLHAESDEPRDGPRKSKLSPPNFRLRTSYASQARLPKIVEHPFCQPGRHHFARPRDWRECRHFLAVRPDAAARTSRAEAQRAGEPVGATPEAGLDLLQPGGRLRPGLQLRDVQGPR